MRRVGILIVSLVMALTLMTPQVWASDLVTDESIQDEQIETQTAIDLADEDEEEPEDDEGGAPEDEVLLATLYALNSLEAQNMAGGIVLSWKECGTNDAGLMPIGYMVYRYDEMVEEPWQFLGKSDFTAYSDQSVANESVTKEYTYLVAPYYEMAEEYVLDENSIEDNSCSEWWVVKPDGISIEQDDNSIDCSWKKVAGVDGYEVNFSASPLFNHSIKSVINGESNTQTTANKGKTGRSYYGRVRSFVEIEGVKTYSQWQSTLQSDFEIDLVSENWKSYNLYTKTGQGTSGSGYNICQGGCTDGKYMYYILESNTKKLCKIVKVRISDKKVVKKSSAMNLDHGNSMTYNSKTKQLVVVNNKVHLNRLTVINASTLKKTKTVDVQFPEAALNLNNNKNYMTTVVGFISIEYRPDSDTYIALVKDGGPTMAVLDRNFNVKWTVRLNKTKPADYYYQDLCVTDDYILLPVSGNVLQSSTYDSCRNDIMVYDHWGNYLGELVTSNRYEIENLALVGDEYIATYHTSHYKYSYYWKYVKKVSRTPENYLLYNGEEYKTKVYKSKYYKVYKLTLKSKKFERIGTVSRTGL